MKLVDYNNVKNLIEHLFCGIIVTGSVFVLCLKGYSWAYSGVRGNL